MKVGRHVRIACSVHKESNKHRDSKSTLKPVHSTSSKNMIKSLKQDKSKNWSSILYFISYFFWWVWTTIPSLAIRKTKLKEHPSFLDIILSRCCWRKEKERRNDSSREDLRGMREIEGMGGKYEMYEWIMMMKRG